VLPYLIAYMAVGTIIAILARRRVVSGEDYWIGGRRMDGVVSAMTYAATTYSAFMMVGLVGMTYLTGVGAFGYEIFYLVGTLMLLSYYAPRVWRMGKDKGYITPGDMIAGRYGREVSRIAAIIASIALIPYASIQIVGISIVVESSVGFEAGVIIAAVAIAVWALIGGMRAVAWTDAVQGVFMLAMAVAALLWALQGSYDPSTLGELLHVPNSFWTPSVFISFTLPWFFFALTNPQVLQRIYIPKDEKNLRRMVLLFGLFGLVYTILVTALGLRLGLMTAHGDFPAIAEQDAVTSVFLSSLPKGFAALLALSIFAAAITTADSIVLTLSSMISLDVLGSKKLTTGRAMVLALTAVMTLFALRRPSYIADLARISSTMLLCQLPVFLGVFHWRMGGKMSATASLLSGFAVALVAIRMGLAAPPLWVLSFSFLGYFITAIFEDKFNI